MGVKKNKWNVVKNINMEAELILYVVMTIIGLGFVWNLLLDYLNAKTWRDEVPEKLRDVIDEKKYIEAKNYHRENGRLSRWVSVVSFPLLLLVLYFGWLADLDLYLRKYSEHPIILALLFFGVLGLLSDVLKMPLEWYRTFVIEEKYGFNKTTPKLFVTDKLKGWLISVLIGGGFMALIVYLYMVYGEAFWMVAAVAVSIFVLLFSLLYSDIIVPLFNKQTPLDKGELRDAIEQMTEKMDFTLKNIFVIDGSKRSTKANAYFTGWGPRKRIVLYDTLIQDHTQEELVAVLAHEIGHYKHKHVFWFTSLSLLQTGMTFFLLSVVLNYTVFAEAVGVAPEIAQKGVFHIQLVVFGLLLSPLFEILGMLINMLSRKFEYQADDYAVKYGLGAALVSALKKMSVKHLSNLQPHPLYVFMNYSHPPLLKRMANILNKKK